MCVLVCVLVCIVVGRVGAPIRIYRCACWRCHVLLVMLGCIHKTLHAVIRNGLPMNPCTLCRGERERVDEGRREGSRHIM